MRSKVLIGLLTVLISYSSLLIAAKSASGSESRLNYDERKTAIYAHMKRYGINRENVLSLRQLYANQHPTGSWSRVRVAVEKLLNPGEHFRIEMDEYILSMKLPEGNPVPGNWIWPYTNTRTPDTAEKRELDGGWGPSYRDYGKLAVASLGWYVCNGGMLTGLISGRCDTSGVGISYRVLKPEEKDKFVTPEKHLQRTQNYLENEAIERTKRAMSGGRVIQSRVYLAPEIVVLNGRRWIHYIKDIEEVRNYYYSTTLSTDRWLLVSFGITVDPNAPDDPANYSAPTRRGMAIMETMLPSLRIVKTNDDGSPDPFVVERVELGPLPVREPLPASQ